MLDLNSTTSQLFGAAAIAVTAMSLLFAGMAYSELHDLDRLMPDRTVRFTGALEISASRLRVMNGNSVALDCPLKACGYPGVSSNAGSVVIASVNSGHIVSLQRGEEILDTLRLKKLHQQSKLNSLPYWLGLAFLLALIARVTRRRTSSTKG